MDQVFNELSLSSSLPDASSAWDALLDLKNASDKLKDLGFTANIRVTEDFHSRCIMPNCTIYNFLRLPVGGKERTLQQLLLRKFTGAPYVERLCEESGMSVLEEYKIEEEICKGLALASLWSIPALSLEGDARFKPPFTTLIWHSIQEESGELSEETRQVRIICREEDACHHLAAIRHILDGEIKTGKDLLNYAQRRLDCLLFSQDAEGQLMDMKKGHILLPRIHDMLTELQRAMREAIDEKKPFSPCGFKYTPVESETATHGKKGEQHKFNFKVKDEQGQSVIESLLCEAHMWITPRERIYFAPDTSKGIVHIGHIGCHLPGKKYG